MAYTITEGCVGCTLCAKNCPVGAAQGVLKEIHHIDSELCIDCGVCAKVCAKGCILDGDGKATKRVPKSEWKKPIIGETCVGCSVCVENCPKNCLEIEGPKFHGDIHTKAVLVRSEDCIDCEICGRVCPINAIRF